MTNAYGYHPVTKYHPDPPIEFDPFPKIPRLNREMIITEKIDGTNATVFIDDNGNQFYGSRNRWITPEDDNYGFARWAKAHAEELAELGPGWHRGEWWGLGIQRKYGLLKKRFSLFNVSKWHGHDESQLVLGSDLDSLPFCQKRQPAPACCHVVPILYIGPFSEVAIQMVLSDLRRYGSRAAPDFMAPEGIVVYFPRAGTCFKVTCENDDEPKGKGKGKGARGRG